MASPPPSPTTDTTSGHISNDVHVPNSSEPHKPLISVNLGNVIKLSPTNYISWKLQIQSILTGYGLDGFLDGSHPCPPATINTNGVIHPNPAHVSWIRQDKLLFGALIGTLTSSVVSLITRANTTKDAWNTLSSVYAQPSRGHIKQLKSQLKKYSKGSKTITEYMHFIKNAADELALLGPAPSSPWIFDSGATHHPPFLTHSATVTTKSNSLLYRTTSENCTHRHNRLTAHPDDCTRRPNRSKAHLGAQPLSPVLAPMVIIPDLVLDPTILSS
ncbi:unnamed protein product [Cuscuta epithymum]|uniref:Retrotransposon Copia-like N-terminal domain-containing protein n=1 Tax=Cuscuta epithymum TaxID=186058 RepID=A0AAV0GM10_9ASTE|nr:unnamed protein product [Cuscuta epithymum]